MPENQTPSTFPYRKFDEAEIIDIFSYHPPTDEERRIYEEVNTAFVQAGLRLVPLMPDGPGKTVAIRKLADARMAVNMAIALEGRF